MRLANWPNTRPPNHPRITPISSHMATHTTGYGWPIPSLRINLGMRPLFSRTSTSQPHARKARTTSWEVPCLIMAAPPNHTGAASLSAPSSPNQRPREAMLPGGTSMTTVYPSSFLYSYTSLAYVTMRVESSEITTSLAPEVTTAPYSISFRCSNTYSTAPLSTGSGAVG